MASISATSTTELKIKHGSTEYALDKDGLKKLIPGKGGKFTPEVVKDAEAARDIVRSVITSASGELDANLRGTFANPDIAKAMESYLKHDYDYASLYKLHDAAKGAETIATKAKSITDPAAQKEIRRILITSEDNMVRQMLDEPTRKVLASKHFNQSDLIEAKAAFTEISGLLKASSPDAKEIRTAILNNRKHAMEAIDAIRSIDSKVPEFDALRLAESKVNLNKIYTEVTADLGKSKKALTDAMANYESTFAELNKLKGQGKAASLNTIRSLEKDLAKYETKFMDELGKECGPAAAQSLKHGNSKIFDSLMDSSPAAKAELERIAKSGEKAVSGAGKAVAKAVENGAKWWQSESKLANVLKAGEKPGLFNSGKTGVLLGGAALVLGGAYAAFGTRGNAAKENERRVQEAMLQQQGQEASMAR